MRQRIITAIIALLIFVPILVYGNIPFVVLTYAMATIALYELLRMRQISFQSYPAITALIFFMDFTHSKQCIFTYGKDRVCYAICDYYFILYGII